MGNCCKTDEVEEGEQELEVKQPKREKEPIRSSKHYGQYKENLDKMIVRKE